MDVFRGEDIQAMMWCDHADQLIWVIVLMSCHFKSDENGWVPVGTYSHLEFICMIFLLSFMSTHPQNPSHKCRASSSCVVLLRLLYNFSVKKYTFDRLFQFDSTKLSDLKVLRFMKDLPILAEDPLGEAVRRSSSIHAKVGK